MKVKNFAGFMKSRNTRTNESEYMGFDYGDDTEMGEYGMSTEDEYGANPEEEEEETPEGEEPEEGEEVTLEDLKAMIEDLTERVEKLEGGGEEEEPEGEETPEGEEAPEGEEEAPEGEEAPAK